MSTPPSLKTLVPSLKRNTESATLNLADLKALLPSIELSIEGHDVPSTCAVKLSLADLRKILTVGLSSIPVDEAWYLGHVPGLRQDIQKGKFESPTEHYVVHGYLEGRLPERPTVDEKFYLHQYPDIAAAVKSGTIKSGFDHFVKDGYAEGRIPEPPASESPKAGTKK
jgi:hypothetical protein